MTMRNVGRRLLISKVIFRGNLIYREKVAGSIVSAKSLNPWILPAARAKKSSYPSCSNVRCGSGEKEFDEFKVFF